MKKKSRYVRMSVAVLSLNLLFACSDDSTTNSEASAAPGTTNEAVNEEVTTTISEWVTYSDEDYYTDWKSENPYYIELNGSDVDFDGSAPILYQDGVVTIKTGGVFVFSGQLVNGQIVVDAEDKNTVKIILNGVDIHSETSSAIHVVNAEKTTISLVEDTENIISDGEQYVFVDASDDEPNAAIFSKSDLTINGSGKLVVNGNYNNGITSKDQLKITGGNLEIVAADDGLMGRDIVAVQEGNIQIEAGGDGIKSTNDEDTTKGNIALEGGTFDIVAGNDGVQAVASLLVNDGVYTIVSGGGSPETIASANNMRGQGQVTQTTETESESFKGLKATKDLIVAGGSFSIDSADDGIHSNDTITIGGGDVTISSGDDGIHADGSITTQGGNITVTKSYEGLEGNAVTIEDGNLHLTATDDGINIAGGNDGSGMDMAQTSSTGDRLLAINGGFTYVNAEGDGLDSNGSITVTNGTVIVNGPTNSGNGALDYDGSFEVSGGTLIAVGSAGMTQSASDTSTQLSVLMSYSETQKAGTLIHLKDSDGNTMITFSPEKDYQSVMMSSPTITIGTSYTLFSGGTATGNEINGLYTDVTYQNGSEIIEFTPAETVTWLNESGITTGGTNGPGGGMNQGGERPERGAQGAMFDSLDEETRAKVEEIMEQQQAGTITREEAQAQLAELGMEFGAGRP